MSGSPRNVRDLYRAVLVFKVGARLVKPPKAHEGNILPGSFAVFSPSQRELWSSRAEFVGKSEGMIDWVVLLKLILGLLLECKEILRLSVPIYQANIGFMSQNWSLRS